MGAISMTLAALFCYQLSVVRTMNITRMNEDLSAIPQCHRDDGVEITYLNFGYNRIVHLTNASFADSGYREVRHVFLVRNRLVDVDVDAFRSLKRLESVDVSDNELTTLPHAVFTSNTQLQRLIVAGNRIRFERQRVFVLSHSLRTLILSRNRITDVYDATFASLSSLRRLVLSDNVGLVRLSPLCFKSLVHLRYLSLINTGVHFLRASMFHTLPNVLNVQDTPFASQFDPPLQLLSGEKVRALDELDTLEDD